MYKSLQSCRAIAAVMVVLFHMGGAIAADKYFGMTFLDDIFKFGCAGVEFFFVLSGFIITHAHGKDVGEPSQFKSYILKRVIRVYPVYWVVFFSVYITALVVPSLNETAPKELLVTVKALALIAQDSSVVGGTGAPVINVAWSMHYEVIFYAAFGIFILNRYAGAIVAGSIITLMFMYQGNNSTHFPINFLTKDYVWLFIMGVITAILSQILKIHKRPAIVIGTLGVVLFSMTALLVIADKDVLKHYWTLLYGIASSLIIYGLVQAEESGYAVLTNRYWQLLGAASYSLYLIHYPVISVLMKFCLLLRLKTLGSTGAAVSFILVTLSCIIAGIIFHVLIEKTLLNMLRTRKRLPAAQS